MVDFKNLIAAARGHNYRAFEDLMDEASHCPDGFINSAKDLSLKVNELFTKMNHYIWARGKHGDKLTTAEKEKFYHEIKALL